MFWVGLIERIGLAVGEDFVGAWVVVVDLDRRGLEVNMVSLLDGWYIGPACR